MNSRVWRTLHGAAVCIVAALILCLAAGDSRAQRQGRADSSQQYAKRIPEPTLTISLDRKRHFIQRKDFATLPKTIRQVVDPQSGSVRTYAGVLLVDLMATGSPVSRCDIHHGFWRTTHLDDATLAMPPDVMVADEVDGHAIDQGSLFWVIATTRNGNSLKIGRVTGIVLKRGPMPRP